MIRLAIHGGAGDAQPADGNFEAHRGALREIAEEGARALRDGRCALDVVERVVERLEECPLFNAGVGSVLNRDGQPELDAAIMDGATRACGAVAGISRSRSPIRLARAAMAQSPHVLLAGAGAEALGRELGLPEVEASHFVTEARFHQLKEAQARGRITLDHDAAPGAEFGTVGAVARDARGNLAAATSTGGLTNKHPGRIGDTPLPGAGTFADNATCAVSCTGTGECFIRACFAHDVHARMAYAGWDLQRACEAGLAYVARLGGRGGCIAVDRDGNLALPFNSRVMFRAWTGANGAVRVAIRPEE